MMRVAAWTPAQHRERGEDARAGRQGHGAGVAHGPCEPVRGNETSEPGRCSRSQEGIAVNWRSGDKGAAMLLKSVTHQPGVPTRIYRFRNR